MITNNPLKHPTRTWTSFVFSLLLTMPSFAGLKVISQPATVKVISQSNGSSIKQLSDSLSSGQWADFKMGGLTSDLMKAAGQSVPSFSLYAARGHWDAIHRKIQYAGTSHTGGAYFAGAGALITWDESSNLWTKESYSWSSEDPGHTYFHLTLHLPTGDLYYRSFNSPKILRRAYGATGQASWEAGRIANTPNAARQVAGALEWFPELNSGAGGLVFVDQAGAAYSNSTFSSWTQTATTLSGPYHNWTARAGGFVYFGGGNGSTAMFRLDSKGSVTQMPNTPMEAGNNLNQSLVLTHPNGTDLLLFQTTASGSIYKFNGSSWVSAGTHAVGGTHWIGTTIPEYGIILFLIHPGGTGTPFARVYKP